jgi:hypothetical protein
MLALLHFIQQKSRSYSSAFKIHAKQAEDVAKALATWIRTQGMMILLYMKDKSTVLTAWARSKGMVILVYIKDVEVVFLTQVKAGGTSFLKWARPTGIMLMTNSKAYGFSSAEHLGAMTGALMVRTKEGGTTIVTGIQHIFLGERNITAAAFIETPLRVQPGQDYAVRINLLGRDEPALPSGIQEEAPLAGLSALAQGELIHIEVRTAIAQKDVSVVHQADVYIPRRNYMTEVTLPMHPRSHASRGQRERVHIFFMDKMYRPLYEKPFVIELFISPLVKYGHEGYYALPIPL